MRKYFNLFIIFLFLSATGAAQSFGDEVSTTYKVKELISLVNRMYVEPVDVNRLENDFIKGMHNRLSPFQAYQKDERIPDSIIPHQNKLQGIGIAFKFKGDSLLVTDVISESGAEKAGIKKGDRIIKIVLGGKKKMRNEKMKKRAAIFSI